MRRALEIALVAFFALVVAGRLYPRAPAPATLAAAVRAAASDPASEPMAAAADPIASYTLEAVLDPVLHTVKGKGTIAWRNASRASVSEIFFHLYLNAFKNDRSVFMRFPGTDGFRGVGAPSEWGSVTIERLAPRGGPDLWAGADKTSPDAPEDETDVRVPLPSPVAPGASLELEIEFTSKLPSLVFRTGHVDGFHMVAQWFPKIARLEPDGRWAHFAFHHLSEFYADFGAYDVTVDAPSDMIVGATGKLASAALANGRTRSRFVQENVHDFAFTAWTKFRELRADCEGVDVRVLYPPGFEDDARVELESTRFGLRHFGRAYGRYPYATLTLVHPPPAAEEAGGMEYPTLITTGGYWYLPKTGVHLVDGVTIHELGHQWFYGMVATNEHDHPFLDEGMNSYAEIDAMEAMERDASAVSLGDLRVGIAAVSRWGAIPAGRHAPVAQPAPAFVTGRDYGGLVYRRTALIFETLGNVYGRELVRAALGRYTRRYRFRHPSPADLLQVVEEVVGPDARDAARAALFDRATVDYMVSDIGSTADAAAGGYRGSVLVRRLGELVFPVEVEMHAEDGTVTRVAWDGRESVVRLPYEGKTPLVAAVIDPEHRILLDDDLSNNALREAPSRVSAVLLDRLGFATQALLTGLLP